MGVADKMEVEWIAHRGESVDAPENTLAAFKLAWERNVDAIELDVHLTRDGKLIVCHDADTKRTTGVSRIIKESSLSELRKLDAGKWKGERFAGEKLPTLEEVLATIPAGKRCLIEIKVGPEAVPAVVTAIEASEKRSEQLAIISFNAGTVAEAKKRLPKIEAYWIVGYSQDKKSEEWLRSGEELVRKAKSIGADGVDLSSRGPIDAELVTRVREAGLKLYVWTVDDVATARRMMSLGVDGITSNKPAWLRGQVGEMP